MRWPACWRPSSRASAALRILPLHPRQGVPAHRVIVQGVKGSRGPLQLLPGFVLHAEGNAFTPAARGDPARRRAAAMGLRAVRRPMRSVRDRR